MIDEFFVRHAARKAAKILRDLHEQEGKVVTISVLREAAIDSWARYRKNRLIWHMGSLPEGIQQTGDTRSPQRVRQ